MACGGGERRSAPENEVKAAFQSRARFQRVNSAFIGTNPEQSLRAGAIGAGAPAEAIHAMTLANPNGEFARIASSADAIAELKNAAGARLNNRASSVVGAVRAG